MHKDMHYIGSGDYLPDVPARDLRAAEIDAHHWDRAKLAASALWEPATLPTLEADSHEEYIAMLAAQRKVLEATEHAAQTAVAKAVKTQQAAVAESPERPAPPESRKPSIPAIVSADETAPEGGR